MDYQVGIIGGGGYTAGELLRLLQYHPAVKITFVHSQSQAGKLVSHVHEDLAGELQLSFTAELPLANVDILFLCRGHGKSASWLAENKISETTLVIDLSSDFRLSERFVYGLPELNRDRIRQSKRIANPGCFATAIQLGLLPLAALDALQSPVHIHAITGSTGAGQAPTATTHFSWRNNNMSIYKAFEHQHLAEIGRSLQSLQQPELGELVFLPLRGDFTRGIFASMYLDSELAFDHVSAHYQRFYQDAAFTHVIDTNPNLKQVINTNKGLIYLQQHEGRLLIISIIDNLLKGASGQAVQNMNLALGLPETMGLQLKAVGF